MSDATVKKPVVQSTACPTVEYSPAEEETTRDALLIGLAADVGRLVGQHLAQDGQAARGTITDYPASDTIG